MNRKELMDIRRQMVVRLTDSMLKGRTPEDNPFYYHPSEDRIVLSHALFWIMTRSLEKVHSENKCFYCCADTKRKCLMPI